MDSNIFKFIVLDLINSLSESVKHMAKDLDAAQAALKDREEVAALLLTGEHKARVEVEQLKAEVAGYKATLESERLIKQSLQRQLAETQKELERVKAIPCPAIELEEQLAEAQAENKRLTEEQDIEKGRMRIAQQSIQSMTFLLLELRQRLATLETALNEAIACFIEGRRPNLVDMQAALKAPPDAGQAIKGIDINKLVDKFLSWPLPDSVCSDPCATKQGYPHRTGTNLLTAVEAKQMLEYLLSPGVTNEIP